MERLSYHYSCQTEISSFSPDKEGRSAGWIPDIFPGLRKAKGGQEMATMVKKSESAFLVMHYQNGIVSPEAAFAVSGTAAQVKKRNCLEKTAKALKAVRDAGIMVIFVNFELRPGWPEIRQPAFPLVAGVKKGTFIRGDWDASLPKALGPEPKDIIVINFNSNSFMDSDLDRILRTGNIKHLYMAGVATNFVVESTARYAVELGYDVTVLEDLCAGFKEEWHEFAMTQILPYYCTIGQSKDFVAALGKK
jgi:nicotinamidase-related amidase